MNKKFKLAFHLMGAAALVSVNLPVFAHGAPEYPISRQYNCYQNRSLPACKAAIAAGGEQAIYDWNGVNQGGAGGNHKAVVPDGQLCAGGQELFKGFDIVRSDWPATAWAPGADGKYEFRYYATAPHRTQTWQFFLTKNGWKPGTAPLRWSDLEQVAEIAGSQVETRPDKRYVMRMKLPQRTGQHVLYAVWQRSDSAEAFYSCSDVNFGGESTPPVAPSTMRHIGQIAAQKDLPVGASVKLRVFGENGEDLEVHTLAIGAGNTSKAAWLGQLASKVNAASVYARIGELEGANVTVPAGASVMQVYRFDTGVPINYALDTKLPSKPTDPTDPPGTNPPGTNPPPASADAWAEGRSFQSGQVVSYQGVTYRCLQSHTAWAGAGWFPSAPGVINVLWVRQ